MQMKQTRESTVIIVDFIMQFANGHILGTLDFVGDDLVWKVFADATFIEVAEHEAEICR